MSSFYIDPKLERVSVQQLGSLERDIERAIRDLERVQYSLNSGTLSAFRRSLGIVIQKCRNNKQSVRSLKRSLEEIITLYEHTERKISGTRTRGGLFEEIHYDAWGHCMDCDYDFFGDIGVHEGAFYKYNSSTNEWTATEQPFFQNPDRLPICINTGQAYGKYAGAMDGGQPAIYQSNGGSWVKINSGAAYDEMTFGYWGSYVKTAITSNNVGPTDRLSPNMFSGCTELVNITLGSGTFDFKIGNASPCFLV